MSDESGDESDRFGELRCDCLGELDKRIGSSVLALGAVLIIAIEDNGAEETKGLNRASLAAIRPQLVGAIAEDAVRVLAQVEEGA